MSHSVGRRVKCNLHTFFLRVTNDWTVSRCVKIEPLTALSIQGRCECVLKLYLVQLGCFRSIYQILVSSVFHNNKFSHIYLAYT